MNELKTIKAIREKNESVFESVIDRYSRLLWGIASAVLSKLGTEQDIEECVADAFIHLWNNAQRYAPNKGSLKTWLSIVVRSKALDRCRSLRKYQIVSLDEAFAENIGVRDSAEDINMELNSAISYLPVFDREILIRRFYYEQKPKEIALALNLSVKQVDNSLYRSKQKLRRRLAECEA